MNITATVVVISVWVGLIFYREIERGAEDFAHGWNTAKKRNARKRQGPIKHERAAKRWGKCEVYSS